MFSFTSGKSTKASQPQPETSAWRKGWWVEGAVAQIMYICVSKCKKNDKTKFKNELK
jgi:hypothetical protein